MPCGFTLTDPLTGLTQPVPRAIARNRTSRSRPVIQAWRAFAFWMQRRHQRRTLGDLAELNEHLLDDIGVTRAEALLESQKPFWR